MDFDTISNLVQKGCVLLLSFADDIAIFTLSRLGFHWAWLHWLSTGLLIVTLIYWSFRLWRYAQRRLALTTKDCGSPQKL
ncbi:MAG: hypothetical protein AAFY17_01180 [Cyanobacteria bacterium J06642_11]